MRLQEDKIEDQMINSYLVFFYIRSPLSLSLVNTKRDRGHNRVLVSG